MAKALGVPGNTGFRFHIDGAPSGTKVELFALSGQQLHAICHEYTANPISELNVFRQLDRIAKISQANDAVAITSWDGAHNPIGRAKVLYDIASSKRPAAIITYLFREFGGKLWEPLAESDITLLTIPWEDRARYHQMLRQMKVNFPTVWICKPRLPNFELASQIAANDAKLILDLDDNDDHFSESLPSRMKIYGASGLGQSKYFRNRVMARTVASTTLREAFGGEMVRHARTPAPEALAVADVPVTTGRNLGFIGTVRSHKNILAAAKSISVINWRYNQNIQFHVYGDVQPESLRKELIDHGVKLGGIVPAQQLHYELSRMDAILTGFPSSKESDEEVTKYQISSKIGDGLAVNRPVLVPHGPSVADLEGTPGVFLFNEVNFPQMVVDALGFEGEISLPPEFTLDGAYERFDVAETEASKSPRASEVFASSILWQERNADVAARPTLLLLWKQHDAGIYGRRIDQVARAYKNRYPNHDVRILELWHERQEEAYVKRSASHLSDASNVLAWANRKLDNSYIDMDGVSYEMIGFRSSADLEQLVFKYITNRSILPSNSVVILFPFIQFYEKIQDLFSAYSKIVDVVDNQFSWSKSNPGRSRDIALQYNAMMADVEAAVFNSSVNMEYFLDARIVPDKAVAHMIPNWYLPPASIAPFTNNEDKKSVFNIVYSGNMNDRIDWDIIRSTAKLHDTIIVHLVGAADRAPEGFFEILKLENVLYHGPQTERFSLALLASSQLAIMPHVPDDVSNFMNPMKLHMYRAAGVPVIATRVEGIDPDIDSTTVCPSRAEFVENIRLKFSAWSSGANATEPGRLRRIATAHEEEYLQLIQSVAPWYRSHRLASTGDGDDAPRLKSAASTLG
ncbi:glycosyltransferase [Glutamicibacter arilaitensis]|uniref:glycosyltransferase n=1 Tax=Glutamicibacter arilaitensis TaxID=256701 RepID=UPI003FD0B850